MEIPGNADPNNDSLPRNGGLDGGLEVGGDPADNFDGVAPRPAESESDFSRIERIASANPLAAAKLRAAKFEEDRQKARDARLQKVENRLKSQEQLSQKAIYENMETNIKRISEAQRLRKFPVKNGRIDIAEYEGRRFYEGDVVSNDQRELQKAREKRTGAKDEHSRGELLEKTAYILLNEDIPGCDFVRSAEVDDESINKDRLDGFLLFEGQVLCAVDFTTAKQDHVLDTKKKKVREQNIKGVGIKYCFKAAGDQVDLTPEVGIPIININGDGEQIMRVLAEMNAKEKIKGGAAEVGQERKAMLYGIINSIYETINAYLPDNNSRNMFRRSRTEGSHIEKLRKLKEALEKSYPRTDVEEFLYELEHKNSKSKKSRKMRAR